MFTIGGKKCVAVPRGGGKSAVCKGSMLWGSAYAHRKFLFFIGAREDKATQALEFVKTHWYRNPLIAQDFPEVSYAVNDIDGRWQGADGQVYNDERTEIQWGTKEVRYPYMLLTEDESELIQSHDPDAITWIPHLKRFMAANSGIVIRIAGIDGSIRGDAETHKLTLEQPRPDVVLLEDIQKDETANSPKKIATMIDKVDGAIDGLAGPGEMLSVLKTCTVIRDGDVADTYLNHETHPQWDGLRCPMVTSWPEGISDGEIGFESEAGKHWNEYIRLRKISLRTRKDISLATDYYAANRKAMDAGFTVSWTERYNRKKSSEGFQELSAQQHAMEKRIQNPVTFASEYQNNPRPRIDGIALITARAFAEKTTSHLRCEVPANCEVLTAFVDVQNEILFYCVCAWEMDFTGYVIDYGTYPRTTARSFTRNQTAGWKLLSNQFWNENPGMKPRGARDNKPEAELESKIYLGTKLAATDLLRKEYFRPDSGTMKQINMIGVDTRWGKASPSIKRAVADLRDPRVITYFGEGVKAASTQYENKQRVKGWLFEDYINREVKEVMWIQKPSPTGYGSHLLVDVNRVKTFLFNRLAVPLGVSGSLSLFQGENNVPEDHEMFAAQVCESEYPVETTARNYTKDEWDVRPDKNTDNDYFDCLVGNIALASRQGCEVMGQVQRKSVEAPAGLGDRKPASGGLSAAWNKKRGA